MLTLQEEGCTKPIMCSYKLVRVKFEVWGMQTRVEGFTHSVSMDTESGSTHVSFLVLPFLALPSSCTQIRPVVYANSLGDFVCVNI